MLPRGLVHEIRSYRPIVKKIIHVVVHGAEQNVTYNELASFVDRFGARPSGSKALEHSIDYMVDILRGQRLDSVHTEEASIINWRRGHEEAWIVRPRKKKMSILGLGGSVATPAKGIEAPVLVVKSFQDLRKNAKKVPSLTLKQEQKDAETFIDRKGYTGNIVFFWAAMEVDSSARSPELPATAPAASRKRNCLSSDSEAILVDTAENVNSSDDEYVTTMSLKAKRRMLRASMDASAGRAPQSPLRRSSRKPAHGIKSSVKPAFVESASPPPPDRRNTCTENAAPEKEALEEAWPSLPRIISAEKLECAPVAPLSASRQDEATERRHPVIKLVMRTKRLPPGISRNTIVEIRGRTKPEEIVSLSGHLDSWDVGQGAMDDGAGAFISWRALAVLRRLGLRPRRTLRAILFIGEEQGITGAMDYFKRHFPYERDLLNVVMESDSGTFRPLGLAFSGTNKRARCIVAEVLRLFAPINATQLTLGVSEPDIGPWIQKGVPALSLNTVTKKYFYFHHTEGDTMSVLDRHELDLCTALWAAASYIFADLSIRLPR
nr:carboxypeptidase Q-like [Rhipicephalus microplus]